MMLVGKDPSHICKGMHSRNVGILTVLVVIHRKYEVQVRTCVQVCIGTVAVA
jgi:hypothetical protein